jgi:hypothetical protein
VKVELSEEAAAQVREGRDPSRRRDGITFSTTAIDSLHDAIAIAS